MLRGVTMTSFYDNLIPSIVYFVERQCPATWRIDEGVINFCDLTYICSGRATYFVDGKPITLGKGDFIFMPSGSRREAYTDPEEPMHCFAFNFTYDFFQGEFNRLPFLVKFHIDIDDELLSLYRKFSYLWLEKNPGFKLEARAVFMLILNRLINYVEQDYQPDCHDSRIKLIKHYILHNYHTKINMDELTKLVNLNPIYLGAYFKKHTGLSVKEYINRIRIHRAETLLSTGGYNVSEVSYQCGFEDPFYFSKLYKKIVGIAPSSVSKRANGISK